MERYNQIVHNDEFKNLLDRLRVAEKERIFCGHDLTHLLDVARIAYIMVLEEGLDISKDMVYAAALLHDIGRVVQYESGAKHHIESAKVAEKILPECGYDENEVDIVVEAIKSHRKSDEESFANTMSYVLDCKAYDKKLRDEFSKVLYKADKLSRNCFICDAYNECKWVDSKKNRGIT